MSTEALSKTPGLLSLGGREFVILPPTPRDQLATMDRMKSLARAKCVSPLDYVLKHATLPPGAMALAVQEAIKLGAGGGIEPTPDAVWEQYTSLDGVRWRVWYHVSRVVKDFKPEDVAPLVTEDNLFDAAEALDAALKFGAVDSEKKTPATGTAS